MGAWASGLAGLILAYLLGAIPTGYLAGRLTRGIDIRQHGSGSTGATNALRTLGKGPALVVILVDLLKGVAAILITRWLCERAADVQAWGPWAVCLSGLAVLVGHSRSIWLNFTGGKSAATGLGVLLALSWPVGLGAAVAVVLTLAVSRIMSLASMLGALAAVALICLLDQPLPYRLLVVAGAAYVIARHRANVGRLLAGTEPRLGRTGP